MPHGASHDAAQNVAGAFVRRREPLTDQERHRPAVIGDHLVAEALALDLLRIVTEVPGQPVDDRREEIGPVIAVDPLNGTRHPLKPHPGVHAGKRERRQGPVGGSVELHEDQVPDLEPARAGLRVVGDAVRPLRQLGAAIVVELAARATRAGLPHRPEVVVVAGGDIAPGRHPLRRQPDLIAPDAAGFLVVEVGGGRDPLAGDPQLDGQELPGPMDRLALEIVTEAPVAEHLEEGLVARRPPYLLEVVVLAGDAKAGLGVHRPLVVPLLLAGEHPLERHHPRVHEHEAGVVASDEGRRWHAGMAALLEEALEALADLGGAELLHRPAL